MNKKIYVVVLFSISCNFTFPIRLPVYVEFIRKNVKLHKMKNEKKTLYYYVVFLYRYSKF